MLTARPRAVEFAPSSALSAAFVPRGAFMPTPMMSQSWNQYGAARSTTDLGSFPPGGCGGASLRSLPVAPAVSLLIFMFGC